MLKNSENFSMKEAMGLINSEAGQKLLALLRQTDQRVLEQAVSHVKAGEYTQARQTLAAVLESEEAAALMQQREE